MIDRQKAREALTGPIPSLHTPFTKDGDVDFDGVRAAVEFAVDAGARTMLLTAGNSHYLCLSDEEIAEITKVVCRAAAGRLMVVAADRLHATRRAVDFAR